MLRLAFVRRFKLPSKNEGKKLTHYQFLGAESSRSYSFDQETPCYLFLFFIIPAHLGFIQVRCHYFKLYGLECLDYIELLAKKKV